MTLFLNGAALLVLLNTAIGLIRILRGPTAIDRIMAAQLLGTGGVAITLLLAAASGTWAMVDVGIFLALLAAFAAAALVSDGGE